MTPVLHTFLVILVVCLIVLDLRQVSIDPKDTRPQAVYWILLLLFAIGLAFLFPRL